jgi:hypothetical protein
VFKKKVSEKVAIALSGNLPCPVRNLHSPRFFPLWFLRNLQRHMHMSYAFNFFNLCIFTRPSIHPLRTVYNTTTFDCVFKNCYHTTCFHFFTYNSITYTTDLTMFMQLQFLLSVFEICTSWLLLLTHKHLSFFFPKQNRIE